MRHRRLFLAAAPLAAAACQQEQHLPFSLAEATIVEKTITSAGGTVSTPAGAVVFPRGALSSATLVTVAAPATTARVAAIGAPIMSASIAVTPAGRTLGAPAEIETRIAPSAAQEQDAWLSVVLLETPSGVRVIPDVHLDLTNRILRADIDQLGTLTAIVPPAGAHFAVTAGRPPVSTAVRAARSLDVATTAAVAGVRTLGLGCGATQNVAAGRIVYCTGIDGFASQNIIDHYGTVEVVWPEVSGQLTMAGDPSAGSAGVSGSIASQTTFRTLGGDGATAMSVPVKITLQATAATRATQAGDQLTLSNVQVLREWTDNSDAAAETLVLTVSGGTATLDQAREIDLGDGEMGQVSVRFAFDVTSF